MNALAPTFDTVGESAKITHQPQKTSLRLKMFAPYIRRHEHGPLAARIIPCKHNIHTSFCVTCCDLRFQVRHLLYERREKFRLLQESDQKVIHPSQRPELLEAATFVPGNGRFVSISVFYLAFVWITQSELFPAWSFRVSPIKSLSENC